MLRRSGPGSHQAVDKVTSVHRSLPSGTTKGELAGRKALEWENRELRQANDILRGSALNAGFYELSHRVSFKTFSFHLLNS